MNASNPQQHPYRPGLHRFAILLVVATFLLVLLGGTVTSKGVGLAVPDWPTTFGQNMFLFPPSMWKGGVFWEHTHRLMGSLVGMLTIVLTVWVWRTQPHRPWLRWVAVAALALVIVQGVMGGLRVTQMSFVLGILHGVLAQVFLCVTVLIAAATGWLWLDATAPPTTQSSNTHPRFSAKSRGLAILLLAVMVVQLTLGASMRHTGSRLAIPDFPSAYGGFLPPMTPASIEAAIDQQDYENASQYYTPAQVGVHFTHRLWAAAVVGVLVWFLTVLSLEAQGDPRLTGPMTAIVGLIVLQFMLGALIVWTGKLGFNNEVATAHQAIGAALLATATLLAARVHTLRRRPRPRPSLPRQQPAASLNGATA